MFQERNKPRVYSSEMNNFRVHLDLGGQGVLEGYLGDISEEGMCAILPGGVELQLAKDDRIKGSIGGSYLKEDMPFEARFVWQSGSEHQNRTVRQVGLQFVESVSLPDPIIAALMVAGE